MKTTPFKPTRVADCIDHVGLPRPLSDRDRMDDLLEALLRWSAKLIFLFICGALTGYTFAFVRQWLRLL